MRGRTLEQDDGRDDADRESDTALDDEIRHLERNVEKPVNLDEQKSLQGVDPAGREKG